MEIKHIKELMSVMGRSGIKRLSIKKEGFELQLEQKENGVIDPSYDFGDETAQRHESTFSKAALPLPRTKDMPVTQNSSNLSPVDDSSSTYVTSPMVGTYYATPSPEEPLFVKVGDKIDKQTVVCIIEAMKVMNEVKANVSGVVAEVLVENGQPVEFGTKLFRIT